MESVSSNQAYSDYRQETERLELPAANRRAAIVLLVINTAFIAVDWFVYPEKFNDFLPVRIAMNLAVGCVLGRASERFPVASSFVTISAGGAMLFAVIHQTGGGASDYYVGLVLLVIGIGVLAPLSVRQGAVAIGGLYAGYLLLVAASPLVGDWLESALSAGFLGAAAFCGVMSCVYQERMRFRSYSQRREIEAQRDALEELDHAKSRFTANIHHELRTPLTLTLAPVEAMLSGEFGEISEVQRGYLKTVQSNGLRLLKLINNLLDLAKAEGGQLSIKRQRLRVSNLVKSLVEGARPLAEKKGVRLRTKGLEGLPEIHVDADGLEKVVVNLLGNALKFTPRGGSILVAGRTEGNGIRLTVQDTGVGIPRDQLGKIFDRFAQVDGSNTREFEGTGIGLSLVSELVSLHGGKVWAESKGEGQGASVHVFLPRGEADIRDEEAIDEAQGGASDMAMNALAGIEAELAEREGEGASLVDLEHTVARAGWQEEQVPASARVYPPNTPEVVVVDDNADLRRLLCDLLGREFKVRVASNGREALELIRASPPDCVLTDVMMPVMSGTELCAAMKADHELESVPVVLVTSKAEREMKIQGLELGADDYVTKPFHPRELMARVRSLVTLHRIGHELHERNALLETTNEELEQALRELKEAGAQLVHAERLAAVGELAAGIAHEINNPVNFAINAARALRTTVEDVTAEHTSLAENAETLEELSGIVTEGLERTASLVGDLRDFAGPGARERGSVDVVRGLTTTLRLVGHTLVNAGVELQTDFPAGLPEVEGDARALNQVFLNLVKNAAEAFEGRGGSIFVSARREGDSVAVEIRDDGPGIDPELRERLFEPFVSSKGDAGSGLGLVICQRIAQEHGGRLEIESQPGEGTRAVLTIPCHQSEANSGA